LKTFNNQNNKRGNHDQSHSRRIQHALPIPGLFDLFFKPSLYIAGDDIIGLDLPRGCGRLTAQSLPSR
jgi:hypothetical protein